jgi:hypothetical protein
MASTPRQTWRGVDRILVSCESSIAAEIGTALCAKLIAVLRRHAGLPVAAFDEVADRDPFSDLQIELTARRTAGGADGDALIVTARPRRSGGALGSARGGNAVDASIALAGDGLEGRVDAAVERLVQGLLPSGGTRPNKIKLNRSH